MFIKKWAGKKRTYVIVLILGLILFFIVKPKVDTTISLDTAKVQTLESTVLASGEVTSNTDLSLSFNTTGTVNTMNVKVGDKVKKGQILATLNGGSLYGTLKSAEGALKAAKAKYQKLLSGTSSEEIHLAEVALQNAQTDLENVKKSQDVLVDNARKILLNANLEAYTNFNAATNTVAPVISGTYTGTKEGSYTIKTYSLSTDQGGYFNVTGLANKSYPAVLGVSSPLGDDGLYITFPLDFSTTLDSTWIVDIPNTDASSYITNLNALNLATQTRANAIATAEALVNSRTAELAVKRASARSFELDLAQADVLSAEGQVQSAQAAYENTIIRAQAGGTITAVNLKLGEVAQAQKEAIVLKDVDHLYLEVNINESNIVKVQLGQKVTFTIDSFGKNTPFEGEVIHIDPGATTNDGIVNYKIKVSIQGTGDSAALVRQIRPGMNADVTILLNKKENVLVVPQLAVVRHDDKTYVRVVTDEKTKKYEEHEVTLGMEGDGNLVEVTSGLHEGEAIALVTTNK